MTTEKDDKTKNKEKADETKEEETKEEEEEEDDGNNKMMKEPTKQTDDVVMEEAEAIPTLSPTQRVKFYEHLENMAFPTSAENFDLDELFAQF